MLVKRRYPIPQDEFNSYELKYKYKNSFQLQKFRQIQIIDSLLHVKDTSYDPGMKIYEKLLEFLEKRTRYSSLLILSELKNVIPTIKSMKNILDSKKLEGTGSEQGFTDTSFAKTVQVEKWTVVRPEFSFEINVGKRRIRHRTTLNLNDLIFNRF